MEKPTIPRTEAGRTLVQRMLSSKTEDRMGPDDLQWAILAIEREARAEVTAPLHVCKMQVLGEPCLTCEAAAATPSPMTDDEYLADAARREAREAAWPQLHHDRPAAATPSLRAVVEEVEAEEKRWLEWWARGAKGAFVWKRDAVRAAREALDGKEPR